MESPLKSTSDAETVDLNAYADAGVNARLSPEEKIALLREMYRIRRFEECSLQAYQQGHIGGFLHLYIGQEAVAVGTVSVCGETDHVITAYRDHGHALTCGMSMNACMAELYGKQSGCSKGKGGSMHFFAPDKRFWGGHGVVGGQTPLGAGIAFALKYQDIKGACLCFMGDGAINQGAVHESFNLAALWSLPVVYIVENNKFSMGTSQDRSSAYKRYLAKRAEGYDMAWDIANGHLLYEVRAKTAEAIERAVEASRPTLLEITTYRYRGHSVADPDKTYRTKEETEDYRKAKDPITLFQDKLLEDALLDEKKIREMDQAARKEALDAAQFAEESPFPPREDIIRDVYWEEDNPEQKKSQGTIFFH